MLDRWPNLQDDKRITPGPQRSDPLAENVERNREQGPKYTGSPKSPQSRLRAGTQDPVGDKVDDAEQAHILENHPHDEDLISPGPKAVEAVGVGRDHGDEGPECAQSGHERTQGCRLAFLQDITEAKHTHAAEDASKSHENQAKFGFAAEKDGQRRVFDRSPRIVLYGKGINENDLLNSFVLARHVFDEWITRERGEDRRANAANQ